MSKQRRKNIINNVLKLFIALIAIILINFISSFVFFRQDLTAEKRFTLTDYTKEILKNSDDIIYFQIYLDGDLPPGFIRLRNSVKELLDEFRAYGKDNVLYEFINPTENVDKKQRNEIYSQLFKKGIDPTNLKEKDQEGKVSEKLIFPGAIVTYKSKELPLNFLKNNPALSPEQNLNNSIQDLEYQIVSVINKLQTKEKQKIAIIEGHGEWEEMKMRDISESLMEFYIVKRVKIENRLDALKEYNAIIIAGPDTLFDEKDKFIIDQFIMNGGKSLWAINAVNVNMDSLAYSSSTMAMPNMINIEDQLFHYGARINTNLILDLQCAVIPVNVAVQGTAPQFKPAGWYYFPLIASKNNHEINKNINMLKLDFASSVDTVGQDPDIKKTIILSSSQYSRLINAPARISLDILRQEPNPSMYNLPNIPVAVLLEGEFKSVFKNRLPEEILTSKEIGFKEKSNKTKIIVIGDGDIIKNAIRQEGNKLSPYPLGYDRYSGQTFGNKEFLMNTMNYLLDDSGLLSIRSREVTLRLLDRAKILKEKAYWQSINIIIPVLFIIIFGIFSVYIRKRKYSSKN